MHVSVSESKGELRQIYKVMLPIREGDYYLVHVERDETLSLARALLRPRAVQLRPLDPGDT